MRALTVVGAAALTDFKRHLRSPWLWALVLAAPVAANFMIPTAAANYAVLIVNDARPLLTSATIGLELGLTTASILIPIAFMFLRAGPTRRRPWQVEFVAPAHPSLVALGRMLADAGALWLALATLSLAGIVLAFNRLPFSEVEPGPLLATLWLIAAPALLLTATIRTLLDSRPLGRRWAGEVLFFVIWMALLIAPVAVMMEGPIKPIAVTDPLGFVSSLTHATAERLDNLIIIGGNEAKRDISLDALSGVTAQDFLWARVFWLVAAGLGATAAGLLYRPNKASRAARRSVAQRQTPKPVAQASPAGFTTLSLPGLVLADLRILTAGWFWRAAALGAALSGLSGDFHKITGPAVWLVVTFTLTAHAGRFTRPNLAALTRTTITGPAQQGLAAWLAGALLIIALCAVAVLVSDPLRQRGTLIEALALATLLPAVAFGLGALTRTASVPRLVLLVAWYVYLVG